MNDSHCSRAVLVALIVRPINDCDFPIFSCGLQGGFRADAAALLLQRYCGLWILIDYSNDMSNRETLDLMSVTHSSTCNDVIAYSLRLCSIGCVVGYILRADIYFPLPNRLFDFQARFAARYLFRLLEACSV